MSLFASRRNTRTEEQVIVKELQDLLDAREVPSDPIRRAKFYADLAVEEGRRLPYSDSIASGSVSRAASTPSSTARPVVHQDPLFPDMEDAA